MVHISPNFRVFFTSTSGQSQRGAKVRVVRRITGRNTHSSHSAHRVKEWCVLNAGRGASMSAASP